MSTSGRDWEAIQRALSEATEGWSKAELIGLLGDLIREYVVERGLPTGSPSVASAPDFTQMDFPQLIIWLKNHVNLPELGRFSVEGQRVILDLDGPREFPTSHAERASRPAPPPPITPPSAAGRNPPPSAAGRNPSPAPASPRVEPEPTVEPGAPAPKLGRGFRGLEFD